MEVILAIDGGGSRTRCLAIDAKGRVVGKSETGPSNHLLVAHEDVKRSLTEAIDQSLSVAGLERNDVACLSAGLAGVDFDGTGAAEMQSLLAELGFEKLVINGDMTIAHAGALELRPGVVALAGTGSVVLGIDNNGKTVKVGGWGPVYGDEGSAYRIGEMSLRAVAKAYDLRGPATALTDALMRVLGVNEFRDSLSRVYAEDMEPREIAALSRVAYEVAVTGDEVARQIIFQAGDELAESVHAAVRQLKLDPRQVIVSYQGSVIESCHLLRERMISSLKQLIPTVEVVSPSFEPVIGAYLLGRKASGWEVDAHVLASLKGTENL